MTRLYLLRHGRALLPDSKRRFIGRTDLPLSPGGSREAEALGAQLSGIPFDALYASDLARAVQTARAVVRGGVKAEISLEPRIREIDLGEWEGLEIEAVRKNQPEAFEARGLDFEGFRPTGGESFGDLAKRALPFFEGLAACSGSVLVVGHSGVFRVLLASVLGISVRKTFLFGHDPCGLHVLSGPGGDLAVERLNWIPGIQGTQGR
jgi:alpha-ribazole phosphatase